MFPTLRVGGRRDRDVYAVRLIKKGKVYDITLLTIEDIIATRDHFNFIIEQHMRDAQEKLQPERETGPGAL